MYSHVSYIQSSIIQLFHSPHMFCVRTILVPCITHFVSLIKTNMFRSIFCWVEQFSMTASYKEDEPMSLKWPLIIHFTVTMVATQSHDISYTLCRVGGFVTTKYHEKINC
ncbi:hypothetical protein NP493_18g04017 [Ridgeia piscesae]|uniref:Uncharacterized protein n=1 Tax=Ridgeia piscesae TaxID=27915 RepID=A0AAD9UKM2_RIDPI|nr:hypothetical protein NP493_18g04017 [Ridgeia piscesae]